MDMVTEFMAKRQQKTKGKNYRQCPKSEFAHMTYYM